MPGVLMPGVVGVAARAVPAVPVARQASIGARPSPAAGVKTKAMGSGKTATMMMMTMMTAAAGVEAASSLPRGMTSGGRGAHAVWRRFRLAPRCW